MSTGPKAFSGQFSIGVNTRSPLNRKNNRSCSWYSWVGHIPIISVHYFNDIAMYLRKFNHRVLEPQVSPIGLVKTRGVKLEAVIRRELPSDEEIHIIAHSMGELDTR